MAWIWSCRRAIPDASRLPSIEPVRLTALLDTNVVSELIRTEPNVAVEEWVSGHRLENLFFSTVGEAELRYGAAILPTGKRRETLVTDIERMLREAFEDRILLFDREAARTYANIAAMRRSAGLHVHPADCQIAAIARSRDMAVATRNVRDFDTMGIVVINPWTNP
jgi:hypothetical protein